jgi:hypothetical protein
MFPASSAGRERPRARVGRLRRLRLPSRNSPSADPRSSASRWGDKPTSHYTGSDVEFFAPESAPAHRNRLALIGRALCAGLLACQSLPWRCTAAATHRKARRFESWHGGARLTLASQTMRAPLRAAVRRDPWHGKAWHTQSLCRAWRRAAHSGSDRRGIKPARSSDSILSAARRNCTITAGRFVRSGRKCGDCTFKPSDGITAPSPLIQDARRSRPKSIDCNSIR